MRLNSLGQNIKLHKLLKSEMKSRYVPVYPAKYRVLGVGGAA